MYEIKAVVEGTGRGLLMHKFSPEAEKIIGGAVKKATREKLASDKEAEMVAYRLDPADGQGKGQLYLPAEHFLQALILSGSGLQLTGRGKKTYKSAFKGYIEVLPDYIGLVRTSGDPICDYEIDCRPVRIRATQGKIIRSRPLIKEWRAGFIIQILDDAIPPEVVQSALEDAGRSKCVGDYRPRFGQFRIVSFDALKSAVQ